MQKTCVNCGSPFEITQDDLAFYDKISPTFNDKKYSIPFPTHCPPCRSQRRYAFRNERTLHNIQCGLTGKDIVALYPKDSPYKIYEPEAWHSDKWDPLEYGSEFDFGKPFFEQYKELQLKVPRMSLAAVKNENCPFVNQVWYSRNTHLSFDAGFCEDALYCYVTYHSKDVVDCAYTRKCEISYNLLDCTQCYNSWYLQDCSTCYNAYFSFDCSQCNNIALCYNLRNKENCILNEQVSESEFKDFMSKLQSGSHINIEENLRILDEQVRSNAIRKNDHNLNCDNCSGDYLLNCRNCASCYNSEACDELKYCNRMDEKVVSSMDVDQAAIAELCYDCMSVTGHRITFSNGSWDQSNNNLLYCDTMVACSNCFGCISLKHKDYCILNKQYTKEEYFELVPKIIEYMKTTSEWGEFFPPSLSHFPYNESVAQEYFPLTKEEVEAKNWKWRDEKDEIPQVEKIIPADKLPDSINDVPDDILNWTIKCETTNRPFRIVKQELEFYRRMKLPIPHFHPDERHRSRMALRNPRKLWERKCGKCEKEMQTTYAPERPETVYCEECYLKEVY